MGKKDVKQRTYSPEFKLEACRLFFNEGLTYRAIRNQLGIADNTTLKRWFRKYRNGERNFDRQYTLKHKTYTPEIKLEAARLHEEEGLSYNDIMCKLEIVSKGKLQKWVYMYRQGERAFIDKRGRSGRPRKDPSNNAERPKTKQQLEAKISRLEMENTLLKKVWAELRG